MKKSTMELLKLIEKSPTFPDYASQAADEFIEEAPLHVHLNEFLSRKNMKKSDVARRSGLGRTYVYDIFSGARKPSRDKVLALCFAMELSAAETQRLLNSTGYQQLYARIRRDSVILYALEHGMRLAQANDLLYEMEEPCLDYRKDSSY